jgi:hypothetical protein
MLIRLTRSVTNTAVGRTLQVRYTSGIKLLNERAKAEEDYYFSKQDGMKRICTSITVFREAY